MDRSLKQSLERSVWLLAGLSLLSLLLTKELDTLTTVSILTIYPTAFFFEWRNRLFKRRWIENTAVSILFAGSGLRLWALDTPFLTVVADFLVAFILLKLCVKKGKTDLMQIIALSFFNLLSASTLALDFSFLFSFCLFILAATWTLSLYTLTPESSFAAQPAPQEPPQKNPDAPILYRFILRNCTLTLGLVFIFSFGIFVFFPRLSLSVFQGAFIGPVHQSGFSDRVNLAKSGKIHEDSSLALRVEISPEDRKRTRGYLRGQSLSFFDGTEWSGSPKEGRPGAERPKLKVQKLIRNQFQVTPIDRAHFRKDLGMDLGNRSFIQQKIYMEPIKTNLLFGMPYIESVSARLPEVVIYEDYSVARPREFSGRIAYEVRSLVERPRESRLSRTRSRPAEEDAVNLDLPQMDYGPVRELAEKIVAPRDNAYVKALKIEQYLRSNYAYTTTLKAKDSKNPLLDFLLTNKSGQCEYFASAMALLLRLERIPARIATGFLMSEWNQNGNYYNVRSKDAHSWVEARIDGVWIEFDPSPRAPRADIEEDSAWAAFRQKIDYLNFLWNAHVLSYDIDSQRRLARKIELKSNRLSQSLDSSVKEWRNRWNFAKWSSAFKFRQPDSGGASETAWIDGKIRFQTVLFFALGGGILAAGFFFWRKKTKAKRHSGTVPAAAFYREMLRLLLKKGLRRRESETPNEFLARLSGSGRLSSDHLKGVIHLTEAFYRTRFLGEILPPPMLAGLKKSLRDLKKL